MHLERAEQLLRESCFGKRWEIFTGQLHAVRGEFYLGELRSLVARQSRALQEANDLRDLYGSVNLRLGYGNFAFLVHDDAAAAEAAIVESLRVSAQHGFGPQRNNGLFAEINRLLYLGEAEKCLLALDAAWRGLTIRRFPSMRFQSSEYRARAHIAAAARSSNARAEQLAAARRWSKDVARTGVSYGVPIARLLRAQISAIEGDSARAVALLREVVPELEAADLGLHLAVARRALGRMIAGDDGAELVRVAEGRLLGETVRNVAALCRCLAPGFGPT